MNALQSFIEHLGRSHAPPKVSVDSTQEDRAATMVQLDKVKVDLEALDARVALAEKTMAENSLRARGILPLEGAQ